MDRTTKVTGVFHSDYDGVAAATLFKKAFGILVREILYVNYHNVDEVIRGILADDHVRGQQLLFIADICPSREVVDELVAATEDEFQEVVLIDHHATTKWMHEYKLPWMIHDQGACGALLTQRWLATNGFFDNLEDMDGSLNFALTADAYDRWMLDSPKRPRSEVLNRLVWFLGFEKFVGAFIDSWDAELDPRLQYLEGCLLDKQARTIREGVAEYLIAENIFEDRDGRKYLMFPASSLASAIGHACLDAAPEIAYVAIINATYNKLEFRARKGSGVDVSEIAKRLGGGGHVPAAACTLPITNTLQVFIAGIL
jgi:oligoribonuclease NrnB/cAMP/cGMP phosphodiesterase (DHH superfamily)